jgi:GAF domain-containing protein
MVDRDSLLQALRSFAHAMGGSYDLAEMSIQLSASITDVLSVAGAGVSVANGEGMLRFIAASSGQIVEIERSQEETQDGPCVDAYRKNEPVSVTDVETDDRWPEYSKTAAKLGIQAVVGYPLAYDGSAIGSIDVYSTERRIWSRDDMDTLGVLADMATAYLVRISELAEARRLSDQLQRALDSRILIEQAKGVLAGERGISVDEAFEGLRNHARNNNMKLAELCDAVVNSGLRIPKS